MRRYSMKIVRVDNYNREGPGHDDKLVATDITNNAEAVVMVSALNAQEHPTSSNYYTLKEDDYQLQVFEP